MKNSFFSSCATPFFLRLYRVGDVDSRIIPADSFRFEYGFQSSKTLGLVLCCLFTFFGRENSPLFRLLEQILGSFSFQNASQLRFNTNNNTTPKKKDNKKMGFIVFCGKGNNIVLLPVESVFIIFPFEAEKVIPLFVCVRDL